VIVTEADEYDRSFLKLSPDLSVITSCDPDHLDIYGTAEAVVEAYTEFANKLKPQGALVAKLGLPIKTNKTTLTYAVENSAADCYASGLTLINGCFTFDWMTKDKTIDAVHLQLPGRHNVENAVAAMAIANQLGIDDHKIKAAVESFRGVKRRFEIVVDNPQATYVDDYAHHPQELEAFLKAMRLYRSGKKITCIFQPHLYSRTKDFAGAFARTLAIADKVILMPIYPARELPIEGVTSDMIAKLMQSGKPEVMSHDEVLSYINTHESDVWCTTGAGDIDRLVNPIKELLNSKYK